MGYIYKIVNDINNKVYIGQTKRTLKARWKGHLDTFQSGRNYGAIHYAMKKYGLEHFKILEIEEIPNELLNQREIYWINYYNSYQNGYNLTPGGDSCNIILQNKPVNQYDILGNFIATYNSLQEASNAINLESDGISKVANHYQEGRYITAGGYQWRFLSQEHPVNQNIEPIEMSGHQEKSIDQYDLQGNYIATYKNIEEAYRITGVCAQNIRKCVKHQGRKKAGNFQWRYSWETLDVQG